VIFDAALTSIKITTQNELVDVVVCEKTKPLTSLEQVSIIEKPIISPAS
jgi:hypothetical protein